MLARFGKIFPFFAFKINYGTNLKPLSKAVVTRAGVKLIQYGSVPFELKNSGDNSIINANSITTGDLEQGKFSDGSLDGIRHFSLPFGEITMRQWILDGIRITYSEYEFKEYTNLDWKGDFQLVTLFFNLKGKFILPGNGMQSPKEMGSNQHNMFFGKNAKGKMHVEELSMKSFMVQITKDRFMQITNSGNNALNQFIENMSAGKTMSFSEKNMDIDFAISNCINSILDCTYEEPLKKMFLYSKIVALIVFQVLSYNRLNDTIKRYIKTDYDKERILFARDYLIKNIEAPPSLTELSRIAGINEFKLKRGFKEVFGNTVFGYLGELRMELAKNDLLEKGKTITEIAFELGYSSVQHFSNAFKKKFGVAPREVK